MNGDFRPEYIFFGIAAVVAGAFLYRIIRYGGLKAAMFGASIETTIGEVVDSGSVLTKTTVAVHKLSSTDERKAVGLEVRNTGFGSYRMTPISLSSEQARTLGELLLSAAASRPGGGSPVRGHG
jgi:hypothetical protein